MRESTSGRPCTCMVFPMHAAVLWWREGGGFSERGSAPGTVRGSVDRGRSSSIECSPKAGTLRPSPRMKAVRRQHRIRTGLLVLMVLLGWGWLSERSRQPALGQSIFLAGGAELRLVGITWGREHRIEFGDWKARALDRIPARWVPNWKWVQGWRTGLSRGGAVFDDPHLVLWFLAPTDPRQTAGSDSRGPTFCPGEPGP